MKRIALVALALVAAGPVCTASAGIVTNGSFESPAIPSGSYATFSSIPGWSTAFGPGIELQNQIAGSPFQGNQFLEPDSDANSGVYQDLATVAGQKYILSFAYTPRPGIAADSNGVDVLWGGSSVVNLALNGVGLPDTAWQVYQYEVLAVSGTTRLEFDATGVSDSLGGYIDAVSVGASVPEPSSFVLSLIGLAGGAGWISRRRLAQRRVS